MINIIRDIILLVLMALFMALVATIPNQALAEDYNVPWYGILTGRH